MNNIFLFFRKNRLCYQTLAARQNHLVYLVSLSGYEMSKLCFPMTIQLCRVLLEFIRKIFLIPIYAPCQIFLGTLQVISQERTYQVQTAFSALDNFLQPGCFGTDMNAS